MRPGRSSVAPRFALVGETTTTVGTEATSARSRRRAASDERVAMPITTTTIAMSAISPPATCSGRREGAEAAGSGCMELSSGRVRRGALAVACMDQAEHDGNEKQRSDRREDEAADHGAAERGVLLATFAEAERHRQ